MVVGLNLVAICQTSDMAPASSKEFLDIQPNYRVWIHSETRTRHDKNIQLKHTLIRWMCLKANDVTKTVSINIILLVLIAWTSSVADFLLFSLILKKWFYCSEIKFLISQLANTCLELFRKTWCQCAECDEYI